MAKSGIFSNDPMFRASGGTAGFDEPVRSGSTATMPQYGQPAPSAPQYGQPAPAPQYGYGQPGAAQTAPSAQELDALYHRPEATGYDTGRMTFSDVMNKTTLVLGTIIAVAAVIVFMPVILGAGNADQGLQAAYGIMSLAMIAGLIGSLVLGLVNSFKKSPSPVLIMAYAVFEGLLLGGLSGFFEVQYPGIVLQAVAATAAVCIAILLLFRSGKVRTSPKLTRMFMVAMLGYLLFGIINLVLMLTGVVQGTFGLQSGVLGLAIGAFAVLLASYSLVMDFEYISNGVKNSIPQVMAWRCAFGLAVTVVWMYTEILRILVILRGDD